MKNKTLFEIVLSVLLMGLLFVFLNPMGVFMPSMLVMTLLGILVIVFLVFGIFIWNEKAIDEREMSHKMLASRMAFLVGAAVLVVGICIQEYRGQLDTWLVYTLATMIFSKLATLMYGRYKL